MSRQCPPSFAGRSVSPGFKQTLSSDCRPHCDFQVFFFPSFNGLSLSYFLQQHLKQLVEGRNGTKRYPRQGEKYAAPKQAGSNELEV